ncbi:hypothetical protein JM946_28090 [Steroidobacter sp. S1-65]|uniref:Uncharacterized protein n=1 Tax=Steroidobacter gossypii TaxID=2805490 RepID=A0ABS1X5V3_9GAMM|nr:hypothetical protein [Steroidobacter gossypii]MBM0108611.1 hypothetical protein [Steroidobacter gossypii]
MEQQPGDQMSVTEATALPESAVIVDAVKKLSATVVDIDQVASYLITGMNALRFGDGDGAAIIDDALVVMGDAYCKLIDDVCSDIRTVLDEMDPADAERRRELRKMRLP